MYVTISTGDRELQLRVTRRQETFITTRSMGSVAIYPAGIGTKPQKLTQVLAFYAKRCTFWAPIYIFLSHLAVWKKKRSSSMWNVKSHRGTPKTLTRFARIQQPSMCMGGEKLRLTTKMFLDTVICRPTCNTLDVSQLLVGAGLNEKSAMKPIAQSQG